MPTNNFSQDDEAILSPYTRAVAVDPSDTVDLSEVPRAININKGGGGHAEVRVILQDDTDPITLYLTHASIFPIRPRRVLLTGTNATSIVALY